jgi:hypothetical protein
VFSSFNQFSQYVEGQFVYNNTEGYVQDNWKVSSKLTLDYGVRFVHQQPQYDQLGAASNFLPEKFSIATAPVLYGAGCAAQPCTGANRQALDPRTSHAARSQHGGRDRHAGAELRQQDERLFLSGNGIADTTYIWPEVQRAGSAIRDGLRHHGKQNLVLRGGGGCSSIRPAGNAIFAQVQNPPTIPDLDGPLHGPAVALERPDDRGAADPLGVRVFDRPAVHLAVERRHPDAAASGPRPSTSSTRSARLQPGRERRHQRRRLRRGLRRPPTRIRRSARRHPGAAGGARRIRCARSAASAPSPQAAARGYLDSHTLQISLNRRFRNGFSFGFNDGDRAVAEGQHDRPAAAQRGRQLQRASRIRPRPTSSSATSSPSATP